MRVGDVKSRVTIYELKEHRFMISSGNKSEKTHLTNSSHNISVAG